MLQQEQLKGMLDRALAVMATAALGWMVKKGWIGESDAATLLPGVVLLPSLAWGWWVNRDKALVQSASNVPGTVVVTTPELAKATPAGANILSGTAPKEEITAAVSQAQAVTKSA